MDYRPKKKFSCVQCPASYTSKRSFLGHIEQKHPDEAFVCMERGCTTRMYLDRTQLDAHFSETHALTEKKKKFLCKLCERKYSNKVTLEQHMATAHVPGIHTAVPKCPDCGLTHKNDSDNDNNCLRCYKVRILIKK